VIGVGLTKRLPEGLVTGRLGGCVGEGATGKVYVGLNINTGAQKKKKRERCMPEYQHRYAYVSFICVLRQKKKI
jgi:hypothetical protein